MRITHSPDTLNITFTGSSSLHKYFYNKCGYLIKFSAVKCVDKWVDDCKKPNYSIRVKFKK